MKLKNIRILLMYTLHFVSLYESYTYLQFLLKQQLFSNVCTFTKTQVTFKINN